ncbi:MarR family winged helix-turn-helix transcriptional regulator [Aureimonas glaciei]|uniref:Transcriptional regulator n=1 Tax=Aureimonas glaciei TaxID=1776957 RepID=A0A916YBI4_9HYPH|nr:MarR family transcriptional regulator [Aureimonas glaciei]GGD38036.1 transcriptional regulator [Aureimonas glaciei]
MSKSLDALPPTTTDTDFGELAEDLVTLSKRIRAVFGTALAETDFHNGQDHMIMVLVPGTDIAVSELAMELDVRPSTVSKMVDRLAERGLVIRLPDPKDSRKTLLRITAEGVRTQATIRTLWAEIGRRLAPKQHDEAAVMMTQIKRLNEAVHALLLRHR